MKRLDGVERTEGEGLHGATLEEEGRGGSDSSSTVAVERMEEALSGDRPERVLGERGFVEAGRSAVELEVTKG